MNQINVKINKSFIDKGLATIPNEFALCIIGKNEVTDRISFSINLKCRKKDYNINLRHAYRNDGSDYWQLDWRNCRELCVFLKKEFVQTYIKVKSKELSIKQDNFYGTDEAVVIKYLGKNSIEFDSFMKSKTPYDSLFKKLIDSNVFYWLDNIENKSLILKSTKWLSISELKDQPNQEFVVYYLADTVNKLLYIGSAKRLKERVVPGREEIPNWNYFRYEIINPAFSNNLRGIEYHSITNFARFLGNNGNIKVLDSEFSKYKLVNKDCKGFWMDL